MNRFSHRVPSAVATYLYSAVITAGLLALAAPARAQFKEVGPPPYSQAVARQKIRTSLDAADPGNPKKTVDALLALAPWYRDLLDQELVAAWKRDGGADLTPVIEPLADAAMAAAMVDYAWRQSPQTALTLANAPLLGQLMARYPDSGRTFLSDLLGPTSSGQPLPDLSPAETEAVCRILLDMPDVGTWHKSALRILPRYRRVVEGLLDQDIHGADREKGYRARMWMSELQFDQPSLSNQQPTGRRKMGTPAPALTGGSNAAPPPPAPAPSSTVNGRPTLARADAGPSGAAPAGDAGAPPPALTSLDLSKRSGTLQCTGGPIPQNAEYVFRDLPMGNMQITMDTKVWEARLAPGEGQTQRLIIRNKSSGPQKRCTVHWSLNP